jgi:tetratricopeptide (TPR) repeat protein
MPRSGSRCIPRVSWPLAARGASRPLHHGLLALAAVGLAVLGSGHLAARRAAPSTADLFQRYIQSPGRVLAELGAVDDLDAARADLDHLTNRFLSAPPPPRASASAGATADAPTAPVVPLLEQRRRDLVTFALDLAGANVVRHGLAARRLVEWACYNVRRHLPPNDFDHRWQLAALALMEAEIDPESLREHAGHFESQFPGEPRAALARAIADEQVMAPVELGQVSNANAAAYARVRNPSGAAPAVLLDRAAASFEALLKIDALRPEAGLRLAHVQIEQRRFDRALASLDDVDVSARDGYVRYLSQLFRGIALEGLGRSRDAQTAYRAALETGPHAHAATMALATSLFRSGQRAEADDLVASLLENDDQTRDVWWAYWAGDFHLWGALIGPVRDLVK